MRAPHTRPRRRSAHPRARANFDNIYVKLLQPSKGLFYAASIHWWVFGRPADVQRWQLARGRAPACNSRTRAEVHLPSSPDPPIDNQTIKADATPRFIRLDEPGLLVRPRGSICRPAELLLPLGAQFQFAADPQGGEWRGHGSQGSDIQHHARGRSSIRFRSARQRIERHRGRHRRSRVPSTIR